MTSLEVENIDLGCCTPRPSTSAFDDSSHDTLTGVYNFWAFTRNIIWDQNKVVLTGSSCSG